MNEQFIPDTKQFEEFQAVVPKDFREQMIQYWSYDEGVTRAEAIGLYFDADFDALCSVLIGGSEHSFVPDLGYSDNTINGTLCFEKRDNNFVIPVSILAVL